LNRTRKIITAPFRGAKALSEMVFGSGFSLSRLLLPRSIRNYQRLVGDGTSSSVVMAPLLWICRNFPEAPPAIWEITRDGEEERVAHHDLIRLLSRPNPHYTGAELWMATLIDWYANGNAYWLKIRDKGGKLREVWWAPASMIEPKAPIDSQHRSFASSDNFIDHYEYRPGGESVKLDPIEDVVHFRFGLDPDDPRKGRSPLNVVLSEIFSDEEAAQFTASLLKNMGIPGLLVSPEKGDHTPSPDDVAATKAYIEEETGGSNRGKPLVMSGPTKVQQFGFNPQQLDLKNLRRLPEERVTAIIGIPAIVAGLGAGLDRSTFANYEEARAAAFEDGIIPTQRIFGEVLRFQVLPDFEQDPWKFRAGFDNSKVKVLQPDRNQLADRIKTAIDAGVMTVAEGRRELELEVRPQDNIFLRSFTTIEVPVGAEGRTIESTVIEQNDPPQLPAGGTDDDDGDDDPEGDQDAKRLKVKRATRAQASLIVELEKLGMALTSRFTADLEKDFRDLGREVAQIFEDTVTEEQLKNRKASDEVIAEQVIRAFGPEEWKKNRLKSTYETNFRRIHDQTIAKLAQVLEMNFNLPDEVGRRLIARGGTQAMLYDVLQQTREAVIRVLAEARSEGLGPIAAARRIREQVPAGRFVNAGPKYRAELIARTETKFAQNRSSLEAYKAADTITAVVAFDARLGDSDPDCEARDGQTFTFEQAELEMAQEHPNGTLSFAPVVSDT